MELMKQIHAPVVRSFLGLSLRYPYVVLACAIFEEHLIESQITMYCLVFPAPMAPIFVLWLSCRNNVRFIDIDLSSRVFFVAMNSEDRIQSHKGHSQNPFEA